MKQFYNYFLFTIFALTTTSMSYAQNTPVFTNATGSEGTLGGVPFTITESTGYPSSFFNADLTLPGYVGAPLSANQRCYQVALGRGDLTITFASPVTNLKFYLVYGRTFSNSFNHNFTLLSGTNVQVTSPNQFNSTSYSHSVIEFAGPLTKLILTRTVDSGGANEAICFASGTWLGTTDFEETANDVKLFPNPSSDFIQVSGLTETEKYTLNNILGAEVGRGEISENEKINIADLTKGVYCFKSEKGKTVKFVKE